MFLAAEAGIINPMIRTLRGILVEKQEQKIVVECSGVGFLVLMNRRAVAALPSEGTEVMLYTHFYLREDRVELYGFLNEQSLTLFELLKSVAGVGPKTALAILEGGSVEDLMAAIFERRADLLTKAPGVGAKTAERIVLELATKIAMPESSRRTAAMDRDRDVEEVLVNLGYRRDQVKRALSSLDAVKGTSSEERLRAALKALSTPRAHG